MIDKSCHAKSFIINDSVTKTETVDAFVDNLMTIRIVFRVIDTIGIHRWTTENHDNL